ncbi:MAG: bifunctional diaminohydroxyphosphoribosylaminopyrimidine deaminase/5-amino-6-(5-phosphoribosylamino)uracil reductase RibD [Dehalococcoidales bacterium]|nr:bifunctional diaminohydroxyphosphoribosylaminopyrimidine deaminase/5-amino-6-(5-phosphoribosylamino)uracil reductase RibD [Dehalococcoidales bacterium]
MRDDQLRDEKYMRLALRLARRGLGKTSPNPMVGAVIVKDGCIIGRGYHRYFGGKHAEINAIESATEDLTGATLYVTLEPCCHRNKKTPPCIDRVLPAGFNRVVIGTLDPNPQVSGKAVKMLRDNGIKTTVGVLEKECRDLIAAHTKLMDKGMPLVTVKLAQTIDGRIATATGDSKWISSDESRRLAHKLRATHDAVMVGMGTVLADDPELTVRLVKGRNPARIILDSQLRIPLTAKVIAGREAPMIVATTIKADNKKATCLRDAGVEVLTVSEDGQGRVDMMQLLKVLGQRGISSLLVEGGAETVTTLLRLNLVDRLVVFIAPRIMGKGIDAVGDLGVKEVSKTLNLTFTRTYHSGPDLVIEAKVNS